jgi:acyl-CoA thioesterase
VATDADQTRWSVTKMLDLFDVTPTETDRFLGETGLDAEDERPVVEGTQLLAQAIVAAAKRFPGKSVRSAHAVFARAVMGRSPVEFALDVVHEGRSTATAVVSVRQHERRCAVVTVLADVPSQDVIRHQAERPRVAGRPAHAHEATMPMLGRQVRVVDVVDVNSPDEVGPPELFAWLRYDPVPTRDELAKALLAHFTGHLSISTTMRAHPGIGTRQAHHTVSTAPMTVTVSFHEPVGWSGWLLYSHESTQVGAGMSYVRGQIHTEDGALLASFTQEGLIRPLRSTDTAIAAEARL